ncbi:hypothetical protein ACFY1A_48185 [Streptomyces sp. NPDC001520]|uniref:hypothetical protein n=1 Tax=Streptomyces sp. NPDC001520 TaxID=3364581 RepID=UPI00367AFF18
MRAMVWVMCRDVSTCPLKACLVVAEAARETAREARADREDPRRAWAGLDTSAGRRAPAPVEAASSN